MAILDPTNFIISRKRKLYKFALLTIHQFALNLINGKSLNATTHNLEIGALELAIFR